MSLSSRNRTRLSSALSGGVAAILLLIYFAGSLEFNSIHSLFHSQHGAELHSAENEKEACHQAIYHFGRSTCHHKSHLVSNDTCPLCHLNLHSDQWLTDETSSEIEPSAVKPSTELGVCFIVPFQQNLQARAPPVC